MIDIDEMIINNGIDIRGSTTRVASASVNTHCVNAGWPSNTRHNTHNVSFYRHENKYI